MFGMRVVVPEAYQIKVLEELHAGHIGIVKMKSVTCTCIWWPDVDAAVERMGGECADCQQTGLVLHQISCGDGYT